MENKNYTWRPVSEYTGGRVLATNGLDVLIGEINSEGDCESEEGGSTILCGITDFIKIEEMLPELKESEDEKIIKEIKQFIRSRGMSLAQSKVDSWIAWLEKQCEQNLIKIPKFKSGDTIEFNGLGHNRYTIKDVCGTSHYINTHNARMDMSYTDGNFELVEQKSAWSEEDEEYLKAAIWYAENPAPNVAKNAMLVEWVKNLKGRVLPQQKQEWSEEDKKMMRNIIDDIHCGTNFSPLVMHAANEREKWFKSICMRYQSKWKPSEAQIKSLQESIGIVGELTPRGGLLKEVVEQLKKLREE